MIYHSLDEIYAAKSAALDRIRQNVQSLAPAEAGFRPSEGAWTVAEILEHLCITEGQILPLLKALLKKTEEAGRFNPGNAFEISVQPYVERSRREKYRTREKFSPTGKGEFADFLRLLSDIQTQLYELRPSLQTVDLTFASFPHWIFGPLQLGQWLAFIGFHEERHHDQILSILSSPEFITSRNR
jgi:DinB superfamily